MTDTSRPMLSVVIPARNVADTIGAQLQALASCVESSAAVEIVVADNGSVDSTVKVVRGFSDRLPVRVVDAGRAAGINVARNEGVRACLGTWIVMCDGDDEVDPGWLRAMTSALAAGAQLVGGQLNYLRLNDATARNSRGAARGRVTEHLGFLPFAHGANLGFSRELFERVGGFDESFAAGGDDIDFSWRAQLQGYQLDCLDEAIVHYRLRPQHAHLVRQFRGYGRSEAQLYAKFREHGMRRRSGRDVVGDLWWLLSRSPLLWSTSRRGAWLRRAATGLGRIEGAFRQRTIWW